MHYVELIAMLVVVQYLFFGVQVGRARGRYGVKAPAVSGHEGFERIYRVQMNTLELMVALLPSLFRGAALSDLPPREALAGIDVPTTILAWIDDPAHPLSTAESLHALLPKSTLTVAHTPADVETWPTVLSEDVARRG